MNDDVLEQFRASKGWEAGIDGNVALINSLQGVQYMFLIIIVFFLSTRYPKFMREELGGGVLLQKIIGISLIGTGLYMLVI